jgi:hypothetical protein
MLALNTTDLVNMTFTPLSEFTTSPNFDTPLVVIIMSGLIPCRRRGDISVATH